MLSGGKDCVSLQEVEKKKKCDCPRSNRPQRLETLSLFSLSAPLIYHWKSCDQCWRDIDPALIACVRTNEEPAKKQRCPHADLGYHLWIEEVTVFHGNYYLWSSLSRKPLYMVTCVWEGSFSEPLLHICPHCAAVQRLMIVSRRQWLKYAKSIQNKKHPNNFTLIMLTG